MGKIPYLTYLKQRIRHFLITKLAGNSTIILNASFLITTTGKLIFEDVIWKPDAIVDSNNIYIHYEEPKEREEYHIILEAWCDVGHEINFITTSESEADHEYFKLRKEILDKEHLTDELITPENIDDLWFEYMGYTDGTQYWYLAYEPEPEKGEDNND